MYMYMYMHMYMYVCIHMYVYMYNTHACTHTHTPARTGLRSHTHTLSLSHTHTCACHAHLLLRSLEHAELLSLDRAHGGLPRLVCVCLCVSESVYIPCRASVRICSDIQNVFCVCECVYIHIMPLLCISVRDALLRTHARAHTNQQILHPADTSRHSSACVDKRMCPLFSISS